jgi:peptidyl-prolyl cis-trans isomerase D
MLDFFRQRGLSNVIYGAIMVATIMAFVITFRPNATSRTASLKETCVARVRGRCVDPKDFTSAYRILMPSRSNTLSRKLNLKRIALDGLVERELLDDEAKRLNVAVTDAEVTDQLYAGFVRVSVPAADPTVAQSIVNEMYQSYARAGLVSPEVAQGHANDRDTAIPVDFRDPKTKIFDMKVYERQVRNLSNRSTAEFREQQARELLAAKMRDIVRDPIRVSDSEAWDEYQRRYTTATLSWVTTKDSWAARWAIDAKPGDIEAWAKEHPSEVAKAVDERTKQDAPKVGHIRHILVKLPYGATDEEKALALAKLSWAAARVRGGESFAEVARDTSDDSGSASRGGDVGDKTEGFVPPFKAAADALRPGEVTAGAVETQFGYHFIERDDPARAADLEAQVKRDVGRSLYEKAKATEAAQLIARKLVDELRAGVTVDEAIQKVTAPYVRGGRAAPLKVLPAISSPPADSGAGTAARATSERDAGPDKASAGILPEKRFEAISDGDRPQVQTSSAFNRGGDPLPGLMPESTAGVITFAFSAKENDVLADPVRTADGSAVIVLKQRKIATRDEFQKDRETFEDELLRGKRDEALSLYVKRMREQAKSDIQIDASYVQEARADGGTGSANADEDEY